MIEVVIQSMQWIWIRDLHEGAPLSDDDMQCMQEVRSFLAKYNKLSRFALHLIQKHFDV